MNRMKLLPQITIFGVVLLLVLGCGAPTTPSPTSTPIPSTLTLTPVPSTATFIPPTATLTQTSNIYNSELGYSFVYPSGWFVSSPSQGFLEIASNENLHPMQNSYGKGNIVMEIIGVPPDLHAAGDSSTAIITLDQYTLFMGINNPDKEPLHNVNLNGKEFVIGTYSENYIKETNGSAPLFIAAYFTQQRTLIVDLFADPDDETQLRKVFEDLLVSIKDLP